MSFYRARARNNDSLIDEMKAYGLIKNAETEKAMRSVDRGNYSASKDDAYNDYPHSIGHGATISAPHMHAMCLDLLKDQVLKPKARIMDVGSGSGYLAACLARMSDADAKVIGIDVIPELVSWSIQNMKKSDKDLLESGKVELKVGDGWKGEPSIAPFDAIHVGAAAEKVPQALVEQLAPGGRMIIPVGTFSQALMQIDKDADGKVHSKSITGVQYVPLVRK